MSSRAPLSKARSVLIDLTALGKTWLGLMLQCLSRVGRALAGGCLGLFLLGSLGLAVPAGAQAR